MLAGGLAKAPQPKPADNERVYHLYPRGIKTPSRRYLLTPLQENARYPLYANEYTPSVLNLIHSHAIATPLSSVFCMKQEWWIDVCHASDG
jgi:hypothetical protein